MTDHSQQRRSPSRKQPLLQEMVWNDEQDGDTFIEDEDWPPRNHTSAICYQNTNHGVPPGKDLVRTNTTKGRMQGVPARRSALLPQRTGEGYAWPSPVPPMPKHPQSSSGRQGRLRFHWSLWMGLGMLIMIGGWIAMNMLGVWWQTTQDDWHYGRPRTFQADAVVGHNGDSPAHPSHFLAINLNRHILVVELPAGDPSKARIYSGPVLLGQGQEFIPVTLSFQDVNGDAKPDLLVWIAYTHVVFIKYGGGFRPARPGEEVPASP